MEKSESNGRKDLREQIIEQQKEAQARARGRALMAYHRRLAMEAQRRK
jgi:hypothetical protein